MTKFKRNYRLSLLLRILRPIAYLVGCFIIIGTMFACYKLSILFPMTARTRLPDSLIPRAEYLLAHPEPSSNYVAMSFHPPSDHISSVCVAWNQALATFSFEHFTINGAHVPFDQLGLEGIMDRDWEARGFETWWCARIPLEKGLHLVNA